MEPLADPDNDRAMKDIVPPPHKPLSEELLYPNKSKSFLKSKFMQISIQCSKLGTIEDASV